MFAIAVAISFLTSFSVVVDTLHIIPGVCITTSPRAVLHGIRFYSCVKKCDNLEDCTFLSYRRAGHVCSLFSDVLSSDHTKSCHGTVLHLKTNGTNTTQTGVSDVLCSDIIVDANTVVKGNMYSIGYKHLLECEPTYTMIGNATAVCGPTGEWSEFGTCMQVCDKPEPTANMTFTDIELASPSGDLIQTMWSDTSFRTHPVFENTRVTITCASRTRRVGPGTIQCLAGQWTPMPECRPFTMRLSCNHTSDCVDLNSECRNGLCWCFPFLSHDPVNMACVNPCPRNYGDTFQVFIGYAVPENNKADMFFSRQEDCMEYCLNISGPNYVCKSIDYNKYSGHCYPNKDLLVDATVFNDYDYYLRDCA